MPTIKIGEKEYHADEEGIAITDPDTFEPIESYICICAAREPAECCCGAWERPIPDDSWAKRVYPIDEEN